jgi:hypothetical protein
MSGTNRHEGEALRVKYARAFGLPLDEVELIEIEPCDRYGERCQVQARDRKLGLPAWTTDGPPI